MAASGCDRVFNLQGDAPLDGARADASLDALPAGLRGWWKLDERDGDGYGDATGGGHEALCVAPCGTPVVGPAGMGLHFVKDGGYLRIADGPQLRVPEAFTVSAWVNLDTAHPSMCAVSSLLSTTRDFNTWQLCIGSNGTVQFYTAVDSANVLQNGPQITTEVWHHVAIGFGAGMKHIFVDGLEHGDGVEGEVATQGGPIIIGGDYDTTGPKGQFSGSIDDVRLYARLLSAAEIDALYRASEL